MRISKSTDGPFPAQALRRVTLVLALAMGAAGPLSSLLPGVQVAHAEDDRRMIKLRQMDTSAQISEEAARMAQQKRLEAIERLRELLNRGAEGDTKAEMMLRLADLYFQEGRFLFLKEMEAFDVEVERCFNTEGCNIDNMSPDNSGSHGWQDRSVRLYENILASYPRYARADQATFFLGNALQDLGRPADASEAFKNLVRRYPQSDFVADAYVMIGEHYFDEGNAFGALRAYLKATEYKDSDKYPFAMYKLAWCYYNVGDYTNSIETMKQVVSYSMNQSQDAPTGIQLQDEALKDLVRFFADAGAMNEAYEYFNRLGKRELVRDMLRRLAAMYFEQGKFEESVDTYRRLILEAPEATDNPEYQVEIIQAYKKTGQRDRTLQEVDRLRKDYGKNSAWAQANASNPKAVEEAQVEIEQNLRRLAVDYHNEALEYEKNRHPEANNTFAFAQRAYANYLEEFGDSGNEHLYNVHYAYGELLYKLKDFAGAYENYMLVVKMDPNGKHSKFCAESAIFAAEEQVKLEGGAGAEGRAEADAKVAREAQPLTDWEQRLVDACHLYAELFPDDRNVRNVIYKSAYLLYNKYRFEEAATQFRAVIQMEPSSREAEQAANLILDSFVVRENWQALKDNAKFYYEQAGLGSKKFKDDTYNVYQRASFRVIEVNYEESKDASAAADQFVAFYEEFPDAETAAQALNNASVYYHQVGRVADAVRVRHILVEDPKFGPKTRFYYDQITSLGFDYETIADFDRASFYYEKLWALYPDERKKANDDPERAVDLDSKASDAIYTAALFRNGLGEWQKAIDNYNQFVSAFPDDPRVTDIRLTVGNIYAEQEKWAEAANIFQAYYTNPPTNAGPEYTYYARLHHAKMLNKQGQERRATAIYEETVRLYNQQVERGDPPGAHTEFVAEMMFHLAQPQLDDYLALRITSGNARSRSAEDRALNASLAAKAKALTEVEATYTDLIRTGAGEWGLAGLVALGRAYENMADSLRTSDVPSYLTEDQREIYSMAIEDRAYVQDEKALNAYMLALEKSYELTLYNENTAFATRRLGELRPDEYPGLKEQLLDPRYTSTRVQTFEPETSL